jgi:hypothetical protein
VVVVAVTTIVIVMMTATAGVVMSTEMMTAVVIGVMTVVTGVVMMVTATVAMMVVDVAQIVHPLGMSIPTARFVRNMGILLVNADGVIQMTRKRKMMEKRVHILHPMVLTQTGTLIHAPPTTSLVS